MQAVYDLETHPATYDFAFWVVLAKSMGVKHVNFQYNGRIQDKKFTKEYAWKRVANLLIPICNLARVSWSIVPGDSTFKCGYSAGDASRFFNVNGFLESLEPTFDPGKKNYCTITLRDSIRNKFRDSNNEAWAAFGESLGKEVVVIPDVESGYIHLDLEYRMALYAHADMNYGVNNGPMSLCYLSNAPYMVFNMLPDVPEGESLRKHMEQDDFVDKQFPWAHEKQRLFWKPDTIENLKEAQEEMFPARRILV